MFSRIYFVTFFLGLCFEYTSGQDGQYCFTKKAEPCLATRKEKYNNASEAYNSTEADLQFKERGIQICLTQIRRDNDGRCFETNTDMCPIDQAREIKQTWNNLNNNITDFCETVCPKFLQIATCKNLTNSEELKDSRFEKFCGSFNESLMCAKTALTDCKFGMDIYYAALEQQFLPYWNQICNSGCPNIDQTIAVIKTCVKPLQDLGRKPAMEDLCNVHYHFKQCVFGSPVVCQKQVMVLISFTYRSYSRIDYMCKTTPVPTTTTTTSTAAVTTRIMTMTSTAFADTKQSTDYSTLSLNTSWTEYTSGQDGQYCFTKKAEPCLATRKEKYNNASEAYNSTEADLQFKELGIQICLTQVRRDNDGRCFETNTDMCPIYQAREIKQTWNNLNNNITDFCEKVCPKFLQIATCKNLTNSEELKDSQFEKFCGSFNESLMCAKTALRNCTFGMDIYYAALEQQFPPSWIEICNSGCPNIDQTIAVIKTCFKPLQDLGSKPAMEDRCDVHYNFKQCVFGSPVVCQKQVMVLISFTYRSYNRTDFWCKTTPASTTLTTTSTAAVTTRTLTTISTASADTKQSTDYSTLSLNTSWTEFHPSDVYSNCISEEAIKEMASESHLSASIVLKLMKLEQCIYRNLSADDPVSLYHIPSALFGLYQSYKESGYQVIMEAIKKRCHADVQSGCEGHRYGLIECQPTGAAQCYTPTLLKILTVLILNSMVS